RSRLAHTTPLFPYTTLFRSDRLGQVVARRCLEEVVSELAEALLDVTATDRLDRQSRALMQRRALRRTELLIERVADQRVGEGERSEEHTSELQSLRHLVCRL